eukprot:CAMPEP_0175044902 /NCGR_PEP_ID=MMETSP0052_2-20121109/4089_1 /TAXON_ID=51329 ORGANISM="Polytomella parva, Strain SAG 63-3" /NCGR_SAMPLE_ID=MMETSP0052_2 /ASSEMBLY_ACC=CAM_ASM_000194 /LENGTH=1466 /DNA_ID=CAMNT_0016308301 /DNA_START=145 /DNA_END=4546 /DNA_ORIENTATION=+
MIEKILTRIYLSRWVTLSASCFIQLSAGLSYTYGVIAPTLKERFNFRETEIAAIGSAFNLGGYIALPAGFACDSLVNYKRYGPKVVIWTGCLLLFLGYFGIYSCVIGVIPPTFWRVFLFALVAGNSSTWLDTEMLITNVRNFPSDRGPIVGILKAFLGLSASIYSSIYLSAFSPNTVAFLLFISIFPPIATAILSSLVNKVPEEFFDDPSLPNPAPPSPPLKRASFPHVPADDSFHHCKTPSQPPLSIPNVATADTPDHNDDNDDIRSNLSTGSYFLVPRTAAGYVTRPFDDLDVKPSMSSWIQQQGSSLRRSFSSRMVHRNASLDPSSSLSSLILADVSISGGSANQHNAATSGAQQRSQESRLTVFSIRKSALPHNSIAGTARGGEAVGVGLAEGASVETGIGEGKEEVVGEEKKERTKNDAINTDQSPMEVVASCKTPSSGRHSCHHERKDKEISVHSVDSLIKLSSIKAAILPQHHSTDIIDVNTTSIKDSAAAAAAAVQKTAFLAIYLVISTLAAYQLGVSLYTSFRSTDLTFRRKMTAGLFLVLSIMMIIPFSAGGYIHRRRKVKWIARRPMPWSMAQSRQREELGGSDDAGTGRRERKGARAAAEDDGKKGYFKRFILGKKSRRKENGDNSTERKNADKMTGKTSSRNQEETFNSLTESLQLDSNGNSFKKVMDKKKQPRESLSFAQVSKNLLANVISIIPRFEGAKGRTNKGIGEKKHRCKQGKYDLVGEAERMNLLAAEQRNRSGELGGDDDWKADLEHQGIGVIGDSDSVPSHFAGVVGAGELPDSMKETQPGKVALFGKNNALTVLVPNDIETGRGRESLPMKIVSPSLECGRRDGFSLILSSPPEGYTLLSTSSNSSFTSMFSSASSSSSGVPLDGRSNGSDAKSDEEGARTGEVAERGRECVAQMEETESQSKCYGIEEEADKVRSDGAGDLADEENEDETETEDEQTRTIKRIFSAGFLQTARKGRNSNKNKSDYATHDFHAKNKKNKASAAFASQSVAKVNELDRHGWSRVRTQSLPGNAHRHPRHKSNSGNVVALASGGGGGGGGGGGNKNDGGVVAVIAAEDDDNDNYRHRRFFNNAMGHCSNYSFKNLLSLATPPSAVSLPLSHNGYPNLDGSHIYDRSVKGERKGAQLPVCVSAAAIAAMSAGAAATATSPTTAALAAAAAAALLEVGEADDIEDGGAALVDVEPFRAIGMVSFYLLVFQFSIGCGSSLSFINNLGSIFLSLGGQPGDQIALVSLFSVANATGRILSGALSERLLRRHRIPRPAFLVIASCSLFLGMAGCIVARLQDLYFLSVLIGLAFGAHWCLIPAITTDIFGLKYFGTNYSLLQIGPAIGSYFLATLLMGREYEAAAAKQGGGMNCVGRECYRTSWVVLCILNASALTCTVSLMFVTRKLYRRLTRAAKKAVRAAERAADAAIAAERQVLVAEREVLTRGFKSGMEIGSRGGRN